MHPPQPHDLVAPSQYQHVPFDSSSTESQLHPTSDENNKKLVQCKTKSADLHTLKMHMKRALALTLCCHSVHFISIVRKHELIFTNLCKLVNNVALIVKISNVQDIYSKLRLYSFTPFKH